MKTVVFEVRSKQSEEGGKTMHTVVKIVGEVPDQPGEVLDPNSRRAVEVYHGDSYHLAEQAAEAANVERYL